MKFAPGNSGRPAGSRNRLQGDFVRALADDFKDHGAGVIKIVRVEKPADYLKIIASVLPKEFLLTENPFNGMSDEQLDAAIEAMIEAIRAVRGHDGLGDEKSQAH